MQWKEMDWEILIDPLNLLGVDLVPIHVLIDEAGIVRSIPRAGSAEQIRQVVQSFIENDDVPPEPSRSRSAQPNFAELKEKAESGEPDARVQYADALVLWRGGENLDQAIRHYAAAWEARDKTPASIAFRLGVAYRARFDSPHRRPGDFAAAVKHWRAALDADPNQYIWRRRIQQYGPRLDKPYPFYDWVPEARNQITSRGEQPKRLIVEPGGAEFAEPAVEFAREAGDASEPDPLGQIHRDLGEYITVEVVQVDDTGPEGQAARIHVVLTPNRTGQAHWNNEAEPLTVWIQPPAEWQISARHLVYPNPKGSAATHETRSVEFEIKPPSSIPAGEYAFSGYALYNVCEGAEGVCLYRRQEIHCKVTIDK
jgi:hypothetical protein